MKRLYLWLCLFVCLLSRQATTDETSKTAAVFFDAVRLELSEERLVAAASKKPPRLLVFTLASCVPCKQQLAEWQRDVPRSVSFGVNGSDVRVVSVDTEAGEQQAAKYRVSRYPTTVLVSATGEKELAWIGKIPWSLVANRVQVDDRRPVDVNSEDLVTARVIEGREQLAAAIKSVTALLDSGDVSLRLNVGATQPFPVAVGGREVQLAPDTEISVSLARKENRLRLRISPPLTTRVLGITIAVRGAWVSESQIALDVPWLPDPKIRVK